MLFKKFLHLHVDYAFFKEIMITIMVTLKFKIMISAKRQKFVKTKSNFQYFFDFFSNFYDLVRPNRTSYLPE